MPGSPSQHIDITRAKWIPYFHENIARSRRDRVLVDAIAGLQRAQVKIEAEFTASRDNIHRLAQATEKTALNTAPRACGDVVAEMRVLETLVRQLSYDPNADGHSPPLSAMDAVTAPTVPDDVDGERLLAMIRDALTNNRVDVYLQPVVSLPQRKPSYYETFSRLRAPDGALLEPAKYMAVAERTGLITAIDNNILFRCVQLVRKSQERKLNFGFFCNISRYTLMDTSFFPEFIDFMQQNAGLASSLIFEFAQSDLATHDRYTARNLDQLGELGFRFSVDRVEDVDLDVDALVRRQVSFLKIDARAALETLRDADASLQLHRAKRLLDRAGIHLIVEKIEEEEQLVELLDYGIDFGQGYLFGTPRLSRDA